MIIGIDLGTTNSLAAYFTEEGPQIIPNRLGKRLTPSVVSMDEEEQIYVGDLAVEIADLKDQIAKLREESEAEGQKVTAFISAIENDQTRMIFRLRFLRCLTWGEVAGVIGGRNTEAGVKNICYRYLESCDDMLRDDAC